MSSDFIQTMLAGVLEKTAATESKRGDDGRAIRALIVGRRAIIGILIGAGVSPADTYAKIDDWLALAIENALALRHRPHPLRTDEVQSDE